MGLSGDGRFALQLYWIMGRSANSRNRVFVAQGSMLKTEPADPAKCQDPSLVIYEAMLQWDNNYVVTNGSQTRTIIQSLKHGQTFESGLVACDREPDAPHYTPRISGMIRVREQKPFYAFAILKANSSDASLTDRAFFYKEAIAPGWGYALTTYEGDGNPLPVFQGEPFILPFSPLEKIVDQYWDLLNVENRVALGLKIIDLQSGKTEIVLKNRWEKPI